MKQIRNNMRFAKRVKRNNSPLFATPESIGNNRARRKLLQGLVLALGIGFAGMAPQMAMANGACYVDYKAKKSSGGALQLHYGVMQLSGNACSNRNAMASAVASRIGSGGWTLLRVLSKFDKSGLNQRRANAGQYFLRY